MNIKPGDIIRIYVPKTKKKNYTLYIHNEYTCLKRKIILHNVTILDLNSKDNNLPDAGYIELKKYYKYHILKNASRLYRILYE